MKGLSNFTTHIPAQDIQYNPYALEKSFEKKLKRCTPVDKRLKATRSFVKSLKEHGAKDNTPDDPYSQSTIDTLVV